MSITMQEFRVTMETIGVNRLEDCWRPGWENSNKDKIFLINFFQNFIVLDSHLKI